MPRTASPAKVHEAGRDPRGATLIRSRRYLVRGAMDVLLARCPENDRNITLTKPVGRAYSLVGASRGPIDRSPLGGSMMASLSRSAWLLATAMTFASPPLASAQQRSD